MRKFLIMISAVILLALIIWWEHAPKEIRVPEEVLRTIPECVQHEALQERQSLSEEEFEELGRLAKVCGDAKFDYFLAHRSVRDFFQPPYSLQKWLEGDD